MDRQDPIIQKPIPTDAEGIAAFRRMVESDRAANDPFLKRIWDEVERAMSLEEAGQKEKYFFVSGGIPVKEVWSADGRYPLVYGLRAGLWVPGYPGEDELRERAEISKKEFDAMVASDGHHACQKEIALRLEPESVEKRLMTLASCRPGNAAERIGKALAFAKAKHEGRWRDEHTPYWTHAAQSAIYALERGTADDAVIMVLHDIIDAAGASYAEIETTFGKAVADGVRKLSKKRGGEPVPAEEYYAAIAADPEASRREGCGRLAGVYGAFFLPEGDPRYEYLRETAVRVVPAVRAHDPELADRLMLAAEHVYWNHTIPEEMLRKIADLRKIREIRESFPKT